MKKEEIKEYYKQFNKEYRKEYSSKGYKNLVYKKVNKNFNSRYNIENIDDLYKSAEKINEKNRNKYKNVPLFKLICIIRNLTRNAFKTNGLKKNNRTENILGCSFAYFKEYIVNQFEPWMTENNHGLYTGNYNETWQLDHIIPISSAITPEDIITLSHYTNLRPLCSKKNLEKGNK